MKPDFALNLSFDGITLLHRVRGGWAALDQAGLDGDLVAEMARLRHAASDAGAADGAVKLIIPDDQIKFLDCPAPDAAAVDEAARAALDGQTPYEVDELRIDVALRDGRMHVAAVARETLEEAEAFALEHGFAPVGFVAARGDGFGREVAFGAADSWQGKPAKADSAPVRIVPMPDPVPDPVPDPQPEPDPQPAPEVAAQPADRFADQSESPPVPERAPSVGAASATAAQTRQPDTTVARDASPAGALTTAKASAAPPYPVRARPADPLAQPRGRTPVGPAGARATGSGGPDAAPALAMPDTEPDAAPDDSPDNLPDDAPTFVSMRARRDVPPAPKAPSVDLRAPVSAPAPRLSIRPVAADRIGSPESPDPDVLDSLTREPPAAPPEVGSVADTASAKAPGKAPPVAGVFAKADSDTSARPRKDRILGKVGFGAAQIPPDGSAPPVTAPVGTAIDSPGLVAAAASGLTSKGPGSAGLRPGMATDPEATPTSAAVPTGASARPAPDSKPKPKSKLLSGLFAAKSRAPVAPSDAEAKSKSDLEAERMTVFGARRKDNYVGGKPRFLGLMLTSLLLIILLGVAAWASVFLEDGLARLFRTPPPTELAAVPDDPLPVVPVAPVASVPAPVAAPEPDVAAEPIVAPPGPIVATPGPIVATPGPIVASPDPILATPDPTEPVREARLVQPDPDTTAAAPLPGPRAAPPRGLNADEAEATYAATGIWQRAPEPPVDIRESDAGDIYVASIDPNVPQFDANALPIAPIARDPAYDAPLIPAPAGTVFDLDERGLVRATPEGAVNPDRVRIFAGLPPAVPPLRGDDLPPVLEAIPERADGTRPITTEIFQRLQQYNTFRPNPRPGDLQEQNDRASLTGLSRPELAEISPAVRPETQKAELEEDITATAQAVAISERPSSRPANMERLVAAAQAQQAAAQAQAPRAQTASASTAPAPVAARTVAPSIPSNTSVSKAATESNAINLRKINLIGVYGQPSSRRALVRLSNGRYVKVGVGDRLDGGRVSAIGEDQLRYTKGGRNVTLALPRG
ncbi:hypothetical protein [Roseivivax sp. CAU 1753]